MDKLEKEIRELKLVIQQLEARITDLENGEIGTGVYLDGCNEVDKVYIKPNIDNKKDGE